MSVLFDISRLIARAKFETPTGIDRFELNYAKWAIDRFGGDLEFVANGPFGPRKVPGEYAQSLVTDTAGKWNASYKTSETSLLAKLVDEIEHGASPYGMGPSVRSRTPAVSVRQQVAQSLGSLFWKPSDVASSSLFIHVSHSRLHQPAAYDWLAQRACLPLFYVHDLIPLLRPEFCRAGELERHRARIETVLHLHRLVLCNSQATARTLDEMAEAKGLPQPFTAVLPPGLENAFHQFDPASGVRTTKPYFVCLGTVEPRKNHALLLQVWRQLVERHGANAPRLVIVGRRGWDNTHVFSLLNDPSVFRGTVIEVAGLNDRSVAKLLSGASALLAPSHIEGYGMPVAEALALGTPVIASNICAHREVSRGRAVLLDTLDGIGWMAAIDAHARWPRRSDGCAQKPWTWESHFDALYRLLVSAKLAPAAPRGLLSTTPPNRRPNRLTGAQSCQPI